MLWEHERDYGLGMDALVIVCSGNTNEIMVWAWMLWTTYALGTRTRLWFGHGCSGHRRLWEHERDYGLGMDAGFVVCSGNTRIWEMLRWLRRKAVGLLLNSLEFEEKPAHSGILCEDSEHLLCWSPRTECAFRQGSLGAVSP